MGKQQQMVFSPNQQGSTHVSQLDLDQLNQQYLGRLSQEDINQLKEQPFIINPYYQGPYPHAAYEQPSNSKKVLLSTNGRKGIGKENVIKDYGDIINMFRFCSSSDFVQVFF